MAADGVAYTPYPGFICKSKSIPLLSSVNTREIIIRLNDINYFLLKTKEIVFDKKFDNSLYLISHFDYKINSQETVLYRHVFEEYVSQLSTLEIVVFYFKFRNKYPLRMAYVYYALKARITNNRWVGDY